MVRATSWFSIPLALVLPLAAAQVNVSPSTTSVRAGATRQFSAKLSGLTGAVSWSVNGVGGGNATVGTISASGLYTAPAANPGAALSIAATVGTPPVSGQAAVTWLNPEASIASFSPTAVNIGSFSVTVNGKGFVNGSQVQLNGTALP